MDHLLKKKARCDRCSVHTDCLDASYKEESGRYGESPLRLAVQDVALSRQQHGFEPRRGRQVLEKDGIRKSVMFFKARRREEIFNNLSS